MKVVLLSTYDIQGGAARSAWRLHTGLRQMGVQSTMLVRNRSSSEPDILAIQPEGGLSAGRQERRWANMAERHVQTNRTDRSGIYFTLPVPGYDLALHPCVQAADVIHLHWVSGLASPETIDRLLGLGKPVLWTLHDQRPFTGGCHFSFGCDGYTRDCAGCPELRDHRGNLTERILNETREYLEGAPIVFVSPSRWLADCALRSSAFAEHRVEIIPYGVEIRTFCPRDRAQARSAIGLPQEGFFILFGADHASEKRKGFNVLIQAIQRCLQTPAFADALRQGQVQLLNFGGGSEQLTETGLPIRSLGYINSDEKLANCYGAADLLVCPTLEDNLPNVILEALACARPVLASRVGGIPDVVIPGVNGAFCKPNDAGSLATALLDIWKKPECLVQWGKQGRQLVESNFSLQAQATRYAELYGSLLQQPRNRVTLPPVTEKIPYLPKSWPNFFRSPEISRPATPITFMQAKAPGNARATASQANGKPDTVTGSEVRDLTSPERTAVAFPGQLKIKEAELVFMPEEGNGYKASWSQYVLLNEEHGTIWEKTKELPGWQDAAESQKLYEMAYQNGAVILEIGVYGGRSAVVELKGALAADSEVRPQYFGIDVEPDFLPRTLPVVQQHGVAEHCLFYHGTLQEFIQDLPIVPTMVFVDGNHEYPGVRADLETLRRILAPGTLILCHDYAGEEGVRRAVDEALRTQYYEFMGLFAGSILLRSTDACPGTPRTLEWKDFTQLRRQLLNRYVNAKQQALCEGKYTPVRDLTESFRQKLLRPLRDEVGCGPWPYAPVSERPCPASLPGGKPWPRITIVTPSFNQGQYLEETILSVLNQNYPNLEYIVMDGGSSDESVAILQKYHSRLSYGASEKDRGQCHAINKGFARSTGEILAWLNSDDMLAPGALAAVAMGFHVSQADMVAGVCQLHQDGVLLNQHLTSCPDGPLPLDQLLDQEHCWEAGQFFYQPEVFFTREIWQRAGGHLDESLYFSLDYELWLRFAEAGAHIKVLGWPLAMYRVHEAQKTYLVEKYRPELRSVRERFLRGKSRPAVSVQAQTIKNHLRLVLLNDLGFRFGAGIAQQRLGQALKLSGHEVFPVALTSDQFIDRPAVPGWEPGLLQRLRSYHPDAVVIGNVHAARMSAEWLKKIATEWPTVFVMHDAWLLTGRCAYTGDCDKFLKQCDQSCPTPSEYPTLAPDQIKAAWADKQQLIAEAEGFVLATNSNWLLEQVKGVVDSMRARGHQPRTLARQIRYGLPLDIFKPRDQQICRELLGLPQDKFLLLFSCTNVADTRKGTTHLIEALQQLLLPDLVPVCISHGSEQLRQRMPGLISMAYLSNPYLQALLYSAADVFVAPSLEEAFGQVFIEAAACGTPSVAYPIGGVPEALVDGITGRLSPGISPEVLAAAISELYHQPQLRRDLGWWGSVYVRTQFSFASSYYSLWFALAETLAQRGIHLTPNLCFATKAEPMPDVDACVPSAAPLQAHTPWTFFGSPLVQQNEKTIEQQVERYFQKQLDDFRRRRTPWILHPAAWLARINRNLARKAARPK